MILVTAANGNQGKLLILKSLAAGATVRARVRTETSGTLLRAAGVGEVVVGDVADTQFVARAMDDVEEHLLSSGLGSPFCSQPTTCWPRGCGPHSSGSAAIPQEFVGDVEKFPYEARVMRPVSARYSSHDFIGNPNVLTWLLGRPPTTYAQFVQTQYDAYRTARR